MITITEDGGVVTLINVFSCEPQNQQHLIDAWIRATEDTLGKLRGLSTTPNGRAARTGKTSSALATNPGFGKWESTLSQTLIFTRSATNWTKRKAGGDL